MGKEKIKTFIFAKMFLGKIFPILKFKNLYKVNFFSATF